MYSSIKLFLQPFWSQPFLLRSGTLMVKQISKYVLDGDTPGIPVQAVFKSGPTGSHQFSIAFVITIHASNDFRIGRSTRLTGQQKAVFTIPDHLWNSPCTGSDNRKTKGVGLTEHDRRTISSGRHQ